MLLSSAIFKTIIGHTATE